MSNRVTDGDISNNDDVPHFGPRTTSGSENELAKCETEDELGFTTDGEINRHTSDRKASQIRRRRRQIEKQRFDMINDRIVEDVSLEIFYKPHTITLLVVLSAFLFYQAFWGTTGSSTEENYYRGFLGVLVVFLTIGSLTFPSGPFIRPHPIVWRIIFGLSVCYVVILQFALFQTHADLKRILTWIDPVGLGQEKLKEKEYAVDCWNLSFEKFWSYMDFFAFSHFAGWVLKTLVLRHYMICWYISIIWELTEIMFVKLLPNFAECWWDSIILDVLLCNGLGIYVGMKLCDFLQMRIYHWESIKNIKSNRGKIKRLAMQFTPADWSQFDWFYSNNFGNAVKRTMSLTFLVLFWLVAELNTFFIKHIFAIDTQHPVVFWRIILIILIAAPCTCQFYVYATDPLTYRLGMQCWMFILISVLEVSVCVKCATGLFSQIDFLFIVTWLFTIFVGTIFCISASLWFAEKFQKTRKIWVKGRRRLCYLESSQENLGIIQDDVIRRRKEMLGHSNIAEEF